LRREFEGAAQTLDLRRAPLIPGLTDAHIHLELYALSLQKVDCETQTREECLRRVAERAAQTPPGAWILGHGWNQNAWEDHPHFPTAAELDRAAPRHPVFLTAKSLHAGWANRAALHAAGLTSDSPDPRDGRLGRDEAGTPNGMLFETAMSAVADAIPAPNEAHVAEALLQAQTELWKWGVTGAHDFDRRRCFAALQALHARGQLKLRVLKSLPLEDLPHAAALGLRAGFGDDWLRLGPIKLFADGALGPRTAAMLQPYAGETENRGMLMLDAEEIFEHGRLALDNGFPLAIHAIGDRANHEVLNAFERLRALEGAAPPRAAMPHRIEHVQLIHLQDAPRLAQLGVTASMQPIHATSDRMMADRYWGSRAAWAYAWKTQLDAGARLAFGSDAPVESPNPWRGIHAAVTRRGEDGAPDPEGWQPAQRIGVLEALRAYTCGAAIAAGWDDRLGRIAPGHAADLAVLDRDPFECDPTELKDIRPRATMVGGEWVWGEGMV
jgi:hypothetical protein